MERLKFQPCKGDFGYKAALDGTVIFEKNDKVTYLREVVFNENGIKYVRVKRRGEYKHVKVAEMVALAYIPKKRGDLLYCRNGNWNDWTLENLYWHNPRELPENRAKEWKAVKNFRYKYEVSEDGMVRKYKTCETLSLIERGGYLYVKLYTGRNKTTGDTASSNYYSVAFLVAQAFIDNPGKNTIVGHKDGNLHNNHYSNLVWGKKDTPSSFKKRRPPVKVDEYSLAGMYIRTWDSITQAGVSHEINSQYISGCCKGIHITAGGRVWRWHGEPFDTHRTPEIIELEPGEYYKTYPNTDVEVSNHGKVRNIKTGRIYKKHRGGVIRIRKNGKTIQKRIHVLVAELFLDNPNGYKRVAFKDGNRENVCAGNLMWAMDDKKYEE